MIPLAAFEEIIDASGTAARIEAMLPIGVRARQLLVRTLLLGMLLVLADHRPAHLTRVHQALTALPEDDQRRLGVITDWKNAPHQLTYRQTEYTFGLVADTLAGDEPGGLPSGRLQRICDDLLEASVPEKFKDASASLAVDWTDMDSFSRPPPAKGGPCADPEASWGHRKNNLLRSEDELFYGYYLSAGVMMPEETGPAVPELARRATVSSCRHNPVRALAPVLTAMPGQGIPLGDILDDSGYAHRDAGAWAVPLRAAGARLVQDLHPHDRGPKGTHDGAVISNGNLYCPQAPRPLLELGPLARTATREQAADRERKTAELARYKLGRLTSDDQDGYHRVQWSTPGLVETRFSPDALVWVAVVFHGTAAWRNHGLIIFPLLFYRTPVQLRCPAAPPAGGLRPPGPPGGAGISSSGTRFCAAGSPGWSRVTRSVIACDAGGALDLGGGSVAPVPRPARRCPPAAAPVLTCRAISEEGRGPGRSPGGCGRSPPG